MYFFIYLMVRIWVKPRVPKNSRVVFGKSVHTAIISESLFEKIKNSKFEQLNFIRNVLIKKGLGGLMRKYKAWSVGYLHSGGYKKMGNLKVVSFY